MDTIYKQEVIAYRLLLKLSNHNNFLSVSVTHLVYSTIIVLLRRFPLRLN